MDESITVEEIREALAIEGQCKLEEIRAGKIGRTHTGTGVIWIQCPKVAAVMVADKKRIQIGWSSDRVELLKARPIQCHRCWQMGHVRERCRSNKDYSGCCFRWGIAGHTAPVCKNRVRCLLCLDLGMAGDHRMGSARCPGLTFPHNRIMAPICGQT